MLFRSGIGGITAAVVKEITDAVRLEYFDQALVLRAILFEPLQLVAAGPESARRRMAQLRNCAGGFLAGVD